MHSLTIRRWLLLPAIALLASTALSTGAFAAPTGQQASTLVQISNDSKFGNFLVDASGRTLYILSSESGGSIQCTGGCLTFWPPLLLPAGATAATGPSGLAGTLGTVTRSDGTTQATYNGFPLYTFAGDKASGDTTGEGVALDSGIWHVAVEASSTPPTTAPPSGSAPIQIAVNPTLGPILVNAQGLTLYYNTNELAGHVVCVGKCLGAWPPLEIAAGSTVSSIPGVTANISSFTNPGGSNQITYNGYPLYTFIRDKAPGDVNGEGIKAFGGVWLAARPNSVPLSAALAARVTVHITATAGRVWGKVVASYRRNGASFVQTCSSASCRLIVPAGVVLQLRQAPTDAMSWPFVEWKIRSASGHLRVVARSNVRFRVAGNSNVTTLYRFQY